MRYLVVFFCATVLLALHSAAGNGDAVNSTPGAPAPSVTIVSPSAKQISIAVEVAASPEARARGLMFRQRLDQGHGMLFLFEQDDYLSFWMRNTYLPLDLIFISNAKEVVYVARDAKPLDERSIRSPRPCRYVLEVPAGFAAAQGIAPGDRVIFNGFPQ